MNTSAKTNKLITDRLLESGIFSPDIQSESPTLRSWRIGERSFKLDAPSAEQIEELGPLLFSFMEASNSLFFKALKDPSLTWVSEYFKNGKFESAWELAGLNRTKTELPFVLRPDLLLTEEGIKVCEIDPVPGGPGLTACLSRIYEELGHACAGGANGIVDGFREAFCSLGGPDPKAAFVVSEESADYFPEMSWLARAIAASGIEAVVCKPEDLDYCKDSLVIRHSGMKIDVLYRFFELFDLKNIPNIDLIVRAAKKRQVIVTPPMKAHLEEKLLFALFHSPYLSDFWEETLGPQAREKLTKYIPKTWIMDPAPVPRHGSICGLAPAGRPVISWRELAFLSQKQRRFIIKPSGFSPLAWGSRGVSAAFDVSSDECARIIDDVLKRFPSETFVIQEFHASKTHNHAYFDNDSIKTMPCKARISPFYIRKTGGASWTAGTLAILCPADKKLLHGMKNAIIVPCSKA